MKAPQHITRIFSAMAMLAVVGCQTLQIENAASVGPDDWLSDGADSGRNRFAADTVAPPLERVWLYNAEAAFGPGSPLIIRNKVVVATRRGELHAISLDKGKKLGVRSFGDSIEGSPLIANGVAYIPNAWGNDVFSAYDLTGAKFLWRLQGVPFEAAPVLVDDLIVAVDVEGFVRAFEKNTGAEIWRYSLGEKQSGQTAPLQFDDGRVFVVSDRGAAAMLDGNTGREVWTATIPDPVYSSPAAVGSRLLISGTRGRMFMLDADSGSVLWTFDIGNDEVRLSGVASDGESVYVGTSSGNLYSLSFEAGSVQWTYNGPAAFRAPPQIAGPYLYAGSMGRELYAFKSDSGELLWQTKLKGRVKSAMAVRDGSLIVLAEPRYVYLFESETGMKSGTQ